MGNETSNNFFLILELDPDADWNQALFERRLREKQNQWSRESTGFTKKAQLAKKRLELLSEMKRLLNDPEQRERLARAARAERAAQQNTREEELTRRLQLMERKGFLEQSEVTGLLAEFQDVLDEQALRARISVEIRAPAAEQNTTRLLLEPVVLADINERLALIEKKDLYHLLDLPTSSSHEELYQAADRLYNEMVRRQPKTTIVEAQTVLAGHAKTQFKTAEARQRYDNSVRRQQLEVLLKELDAALRHASEKKVYFQQVEDFVERADHVGWAREVALQELQIYAREHGWTLQTQAEVQMPERLRQMVENRLFYTARNYLTTRSASEQHAFQASIEDEIARALDIFKQAIAEGTDAQRIQRCLQALAMCADFQQAREYLKTLSLPAPSDLQAHKVGDTVHLAWQSVPLADVNYILVRRSSQQPSSYSDGLVLTTTRALTYADAAPETGVPLYYAVFTECAGVISTQGALLQQPVLLLQEVSNEQVSVDNQLVQLRWEVPANVHAISVVRKENAAPIDSKDGQALSVTNLTGCTDQAVQNGHTYFYVIYCIFRLPNGSTIVSDGKIVKAIPEAPPDIIRQLQIEQTGTPQGFALRICWQARKEQVLILKSRQAPALTMGATLPVNALDHYGEVLQGRQDCVQDFWTKPESVFYTPAILMGERVYIGSPQRYLCMPEVYNLRAQNTNTGLRLTWLWPADCNEARLFYSTEHWPQPAKDNPQFITIARSEYEALGHYLLRGTTQQNYYLVVSLLMRHEGQRMLTRGTTLYIPLASKKDITYEIKNPRFGYKQRTLHLYSQVPCQLPTLLLIMRQGSLPARKTEGTLLQRVEGPLSVQREHVVVLPDTKFPSHTFGKLFLEDDRLYAEVTINLPEERKLRLS